MLKLYIYSGIPEGVLSHLHMNVVEIYNCVHRMFHFVGLYRERHTEILLKFSTKLYYIREEDILKNIETSVQISVRNRSTKLNIKT